LRSRAARSRRRSIMRSNVFARPARATRRECASIGGREPSGMGSGGANAAAWSRR